MKYNFRKYSPFYLPFKTGGKPMTPHLLRCQGFAVANYSFTLGRLATGASSTFAQLGYDKGELTLNVNAFSNR
jgi:hypothetical protein